MSKKEMISYKPKNTRKYQGIPGITQEYLRAKKYPQKNLIVYFNTPTQPEPDPLTIIFSNTQPGRNRY